MKRHLQSVLLLTGLIVLPLLTLYAQPQHCRDGFAEPPRVDPRSPDVLCLPETGRIYGKLNCTSLNPENYGMEITPVNDVNSDNIADWIIAHNRCDSPVATRFGAEIPKELLLYHGVKGGLPTSESGVRIGPTEIGTYSTVVASGDWDGDGRVDLAIHIRFYDDTSFGNVDGYNIGPEAIFWGQADGSFTVNDTSHLLASQVDNWMSGDRGASGDFDGDGVDDLLFFIGGSLDNGKPVETPRLMIYRGHRGKRWGDDGVSRFYDWGWWSPPIIRDIGIIDHDGDGALDVILYNNDIPVVSTLGVLYGSPSGGLPDTSNYQYTTLEGGNVHYTLLADVTGDHIPELIGSCGGEETIKVWLGLKGQRLIEQFGTGHDAPDAGRKQWWGRPWAQLWQPKRINDYWGGPVYALYDLGDGDRDGVGDIWTLNAPWVTCYSGGEKLDSLIDGMIDGRPGITPFYDHVDCITRLGDIDGSGVETIAMKGSGIIFVKPSQEHQRFHWRMVPDGTGPADVSREEPVSNPSTLELQAVPNPASEEVRLQWHGTGLLGTLLLTISDERGDEVERLTVAATEGGTLWKTAGYATGTCFVTVRSADGRRATQTVVIR